MGAPTLVPGHIAAGKYAVQQTLAHHGLCSTHQAITLPNREVVIKLFDPHLSNMPAALQNLQRAIGNVPCESIIPILDCGRDKETGAAFTVSELSAFPSLEQLVELCPLSLEEAGALLLNLSTSLSQAHDKQLLHLGLKPTNIFVAPQPLRTATIADFCVLPRSSLAAAEHAVPWMAPELLTQGQVGPATDVFSLALIAFYSITGRSYWHACRSQDVDVVAWKAEAHQLRVPASVRAAEHGVSIDSGIDQVLSQALALRPSDRYPSVVAFAQDFSKAAKCRPPKGSSPALVTMPRVQPALSQSPPTRPPILTPPIIEQAAPIAIEPASPMQGYGERSAASELVSPAPAHETVHEPERIHVASSTEAIVEELDSAYGAPPKKSRRLALFGIMVTGACAAGALLLWNATRSRPSVLSAPRGSGLIASATAPDARKGTGVVEAVSVESLPDKTPPRAQVDESQHEQPDSKPGALGETTDRPESEIKIRCSPRCESVSLDGKPVEADVFFQVAPGEHTLVGRSSSGAAQRIRIAVEAGKKRVMYLTIPNERTEKNCGKFLKRCK